MSIRTLLNGDLQLVMKAFDRSQAIISFAPDGTILDANENFCKAVGYRRDELVGNHHRIFVDPREANSEAYVALWKRLAGGQFDQRQYSRIGKGGRRIWIEASYNPILRRGRVVKVVKIATDITEYKRESLENKGKIEALSRAQAVIEFTPGGQILTANDNFLQSLGYRLDEIVGEHHRIFCEADYAASKQYAEFWPRLAAGEYFSDQFKRLRKDGSAVYIQATYNPILDADGTVLKVVKFATDVSGRVRALGEIGAGLERLAEADIRITIDEPFADEFEHLRHAFNQSMAKFQQTLEQVRAQTAMLSARSLEMTTSASQVALRSVQQEAALNEASVALGKITSTVHQAVDRTSDARNLVGEASAVASKSVQVMAQTVGAMDRIEAASRQITNIIDVIDEIAFFDQSSGAECRG